MKNPRNIVVKTLFNPDEFLAFEAKCKASDVSHSRVLRDLANHWIAKRSLNDRRRSRRTERPDAGHKLSMILPSRVGNRAMHMRL